MLFFAFNPILVAAAVIPALLLLIYVYRADRLEPESPRLLFVLVIEGIIATALAVFTETIGETVLGWFLKEDSRIYSFCSSFLIYELTLLLFIRVTSAVKYWLVAPMSLYSLRALTQYSPS